MVYLARAYFKCGRLKECKTILLKVPTIAPLSLPHTHKHNTDKYDIIEQDYHTVGTNYYPSPSLPNPHTDKYDTIEQDYSTKGTKPPPNTQR